VGVALQAFFALYVAALLFWVAWLILKSL